jgi:hypothetical protein
MQVASRKEKVFMEARPSTTISNMPITPNHQQVIDDALQLVLARLQELAPTIAYGVPPTLSLDQLRQGSLAKELRIIARYAEGYDLGQGDIRPTIRSVARILYPVPMATSGFLFPPDFHKTPLGEMVHAALARHYPRSERMTVGEVTRLLQVSRQTAHEWAENNTLMPVYDKGTLTFTRRQVEHLYEQRKGRKQDRGKREGSEEHLS